VTCSFCEAQVRAVKAKNRLIGNQFFERPHPVYGYAVTSHGSQGQTAHGVLIHVDTEKSERLVNNRFA
jgi:hypothetical protein